MLYQVHNQFRESLIRFEEADPHLYALSKLKYQYHFEWWHELPLDTPGIYILTGGRQIGKSTSCKLLIRYCLEEKIFPPDAIFYLPCDEIYNANQFAQTMRFLLVEMGLRPFLMIIDEVTYVKNWDRVIKALADEGYFKLGLCLLTGSDTLILKEAAMRFPGRRGQADKTDFHLYPLSFREYKSLHENEHSLSPSKIMDLFKDYLQCGGYLRAINDLATYGKITEATFATYEQWIRGDFLQQGKNEDTLLALLETLLKVGVSQISYSGLTQKMGRGAKETCIDYCRLLERMDILFTLQAYDQNKKLGFPKKDRKFHFLDPFIYRTCVNWLQREGYLNSLELESGIVEACVASHCYRAGKAFYFKGDGEIDVIWLKSKIVHAIEIKWFEQIRPNELKMLNQFKNSFLLSKNPVNGFIEHVKVLPVYEFLLDLQI